MIFRAIWPITDTGAHWADLIMYAKDEVPMLAAQAHARLTGAGRFSIADSRFVPGSGRVSDHVLIYEAPAKTAPRRAYHLESA